MPILNEEDNLINESLQLEGVFDAWKKLIGKKPKDTRDIQDTTKTDRMPVAPKKASPSKVKAQPITRQDAHVDAPDTPETAKLDSHLEHFKGNADIIGFLNYIQNPNNFKEMDRKAFVVFYKKYREMVDLLMGAFPFLKVKARSLRMIVPKVVEPPIRQIKVDSVQRVIRKNLGLEE